MASKSYQYHSLVSRGLFWGKLSPLPPLVYRFSHNLIWWPFRLVFSYFLDFQVESQENLEKLKGPLIVAINHSCWLDPFIVSNAFPFRARIHAVRYACWYKYYYSLKNYIFVRFLGAFPIKKKENLEEVLKVPVDILKDRGVVGIFPEGRRYRKGRHAKGRRGAAYLALKTKTKILPVKIEGTANMRLLWFFLKKYKVKVKIGKVFCLHCIHNQKIERLKDLNKPTDYIMEKIREL